MCVLPNSTFGNQLGIGVAFSTYALLENIKQAKQGCSTICVEMDGTYKLEFNGYVFVHTWHTLCRSEGKKGGTTSIEAYFLALNKIRVDMLM